MRFSAIDGRKLARIIWTLAIGAAGGVVATWLSLPASWLLGAALAAMTASVAGLETEIPAPLRELAFVFIGLSIGSSVSERTLSDLTRWPVSLVAVIVCVAMIIFVAYIYLTRVARFDRGTAFLTAIPGALSYTIALALDGYGDPRKVALAQSIRLIVLITTVPLFVDLVSEVTPMPPLAATTIVPLAALSVAGLVAGAVCQRLSVPSPYLLGGLFVSVGAHLSGIIGGAVPIWLIAPAFIVTGALTGGRFVGTSVAEFRNALGAGLVIVILASLISAVFAVAIALFLSLPFGQVWVAFAPGGLEAMIAVALSLNLDPAYVSAHQLLRFLAISVAVPFIISAMKLRKEARTEV